MVIPVFFFVALALAVFSYSQGQGGPVAGIVFFGVLFLGILAHLGRNTLVKARPQTPDGQARE